MKDLKWTKLCQKLRTFCENHWKSIFSTISSWSLYIPSLWVEHSMSLTSKVFGFQFRWIKDLGRCVMLIYKYTALFAQSLLSLLNSSLSLICTRVKWRRSSYLDEYIPKKLITPLTTIVQCSIVQNSTTLDVKWTAWFIEFDNIYIS